MVPGITTLLLVVMAATATVLVRRLASAADDLAAAVARTEALHDAGAALERTLEHARARRTQLRDSVSRTPDR